MGANSSKSKNEITNKKKININGDNNTVVDRDSIQVGTEMGQSLAPNVSTDLTHANPGGYLLDSKGVPKVNEDGEILIVLSNKFMAFYHEILMKLDMYEPMLVVQKYQIESNSYYGIARRYGTPGVGMYTSQIMPPDNYWSMPISRVTRLSHDLKAHYDKISELGGQVQEVLNLVPCYKRPGHGVLTKDRVFELIGLAPVYLPNNPLVISYPLELIYIINTLMHDFLIKVTDSAGRQVLPVGIPQTRYSPNSLIISMDQARAKESDTNEFIANTHYEAHRNAIEAESATELSAIDTAVQLSDFATVAPLERRTKHVKWIEAQSVGGNVTMCNSAVTERSWFEFDATSGVCRPALEFNSVSALPIFSVCGLNNVIAFKVAAGILNSTVANYKQVTKFLNTAGHAASVTDILNMDLGMSGNVVSRELFVDTTPYADPPYTDTGRMILDDNTTNAVVLIFLCTNNAMNIEDIVVEQNDDIVRRYASETFQLDVTWDAGKVITRPVGYVSTFQFTKEEVEKYKHMFAVIAMEHRPMARAIRSSDLSNSTVKYTHVLSDMVTHNGLPVTEVIPASMLHSMTTFALLNSPPHELCMVMSHSDDQFDSKLCDDIAHSEGVWEKTICTMAAEELESEEGEAGTTGFLSSFKDKVKDLRKAFPFDTFKTAMTSNSRYLGAKFSTASALKDLSDDVTKATTGFMTSHLKSVPKKLVRSGMDKLKKQGFSSNVRTMLGQFDKVAKYALEEEVEET